MSPAQWFLNAGLALAILLPDALGTLLLQIPEQWNLWLGWR